MASIGFLIGGALVNALAFTGSNYLFSSLSKESIDKERKRHDKAIEDLQRAQIEWAKERQERLDYINNQIMKQRKAEKRSTIYINESGLYTLIFTSKLESAKIFMKWVTSEVLPSIRKTGLYVMPIDVGHKINNALTFRIENETDLHVKVVSFLKKRFPYSIFVAPLGENQDTSIKRIDSFNKSYIKGTPDLIINNLHRYYTGFAIEFKTPKGYGTLSNEQSNILFHYQLNGFKTLVSNDYDRIVEKLLVYFRDVRVKCSFCPRRFISSQSLRNHIKGFHKM